MKNIKTIVTLALLGTLATSSVSFTAVKAVENTHKGAIKSQLKANKHATERLIEDFPISVTNGNSKEKLEITDSVTLGTIKKAFNSTSNFNKHIDILKRIVQFLFKSNSKDIVKNFNFTENQEGWTGGFADLPINSEDFYELKFKHATIPVVDKKDKGLLLKGNNHSDDLFMYITKKFSKKDGLVPNTTYKVNLSFDMATNVAGGMMGVGGSPGSSVYVKAGVINTEPKSDVKNEYLRINIDKANQSQSGKDMIVLGNIEKVDTGDKSSIDKSFQYKSFETSIEVATNENGEAWVIIGTDSGFEGLTELYYTNIKVTFNKTIK